MCVLAPVRCIIDEGAFSAASERERETAGECKGMQLKFASSAEIPLPSCLKFSLVEPSQKEWRKRKPARQGAGPRQLTLRLATCQAQQSAAAAKNTVTITVKAAGKQHSELDSSLVYTQREPTGRRCRRIATKGQHRMWRKGQTRPDRGRDEGRPSQKATDSRAKEKGKKVMKMHFHFS